MTTLVIGTGFVGSELTARLRDRCIDVTQTSRIGGAADVHVAHGAALDHVLANHTFDQVVVVGQLTKPNIDWVLERIEGPHWVVLSSHQITSTTAAPQARVALAREEVALARGACVLRPTMIYGKGRDKNLSRLIRLMRRWRVPVVPSSGSELIQPVHVDDLIELISRHAKTLAGGLYPVGGAEALPVRELVETLAQVIGLRFPVVAVPEGVLQFAARFAPIIGVRPDQVHRLREPKIVDMACTIATFEWLPAPLGIRLEQAVREALPSGGGGRRA